MRTEGMRKNCKSNSLGTGKGSRNCRPTSIPLCSGRTRSQNCRMHTHSGLFSRFGTGLSGSQGRIRSRRSHKLKHSSSPGSHSGLRGRGGNFQPRRGRTRRSRASRRARKSTFCSRPELKSSPRTLMSHLGRGPRCTFDSGSS